MQEILVYLPPSLDGRRVVSVNDFQFLPSQPRPDQVGQDGHHAVLKYRAAHRNEKHAFRVRHIHLCVHVDHGFASIRLESVSDVRRGADLGLHVRQRCGTKQGANKRKNKQFFHVRTSSIPESPVNHRAVHGADGQ